MKKDKVDNFFIETVKDLYVDEPGISMESKDRIYNNIMKLHERDTWLDRLTAFMLKNPLKAAFLGSGLQSAIFILIFQERYIDFISRVIGGM